MPETGNASPFDLLAAGGPVMYILATLSVLMVTVALLKLWRFWRAGLFRAPDFNAAIASWSRGQRAEAQVALTTAHHPAACVVEAAMAALSTDRPDTDAAREETERIGKAALAIHSRHLRLLSMIATISPLLGLLGTVLGMIAAFRAMELAGARVDPGVLSGGIWIALLTTAAGLIVAIPAAAVHAVLEGAVTRTGQAMEDAAARVFTAHARSAGEVRQPVRLVTDGTE